MENKLEQLLNSLIEKGWKPRWLNIMWKIVIDYDIEFAFDIYDSLQKWHWNFRELVSKESWLWQFVCENMLINKKWFYWDEYCIAEHCEYTPKYYKFRLIESALCDEDKLEDFLLNSIKLD